MAHVQDRGTEGNRKRWQARYRTPSGEERTRSFERKVDARRWLVEQEASVQRGTWVDPTLSRTTVGQWAPTWLDTKRNLKPKTIAGYESLLRSRILPTFADVPLAGVERIAVERWVSGMLAEGLSASRVRQAYNVLAQMLDAAVDNGMLARNVVRGIDLPRVTSPERRFLTAGQVAELAREIDAPYRALVYVMAYGGLRWGEAVALRRRSLDLLHGRIEVTSSLADVNGQLIFGDPKTHQAASVSVPGFVTDVLGDHLEEYVQPATDALVFTTASGTPLRHNNFLRRRWKPAAARANVPDDVTPHELRHTCAALLIAQGADPKAIQAQLRHSSIQVTFDTYGHLFPGHLNDVMDALSEAHAEAVAERTRNEGAERRLREVT